MKEKIKNNICPICSGALVKLMSLFKKTCGDCGAVYKWPLDDGQKPLVKHQK